MLPWHACWGTTFLLEQFAQQSRDAHVCPGLIAATAAGSVCFLMHAAAA